MPVFLEKNIKKASKPEGMEAQKLRLNSKYLYLKFFFIF